MTGVVTEPAGLRIAMIASYPGVGQVHPGHSGVSTYSVHLARALVRNGASVTVVAPALGGEPPVTFDDGVRIERRFRRGVAGLPAALRAAHRLDVDIVHVQHELFLYGGVAAVPGLASLAWPRASHRPTVVTMHQVVDPASVDASYTRLHRVGVPAAAARLGLTAVQRLVPAAADRVVVHEPAFTDFVPGAEVIPHGVERSAPQDSAVARAALGAPPDGLLALCFGFIAPYKDLETACEAAVQAGDGVHLVVAGGEHPRLAESGSTYADQLRDRYGARVTFVGYVPAPDVGLWFSAADVALFCYPRPHASSGALALAYGYQTPVLLSPALGRTVDAPDDLVVADGVAPLAARLSGLARDPAPLEGMRAAVARIAAGRTWDVAARRHLAVYRQVLDSTPAAVA